MVERPHREMLEKTHLHDTFFGLKNAAAGQDRPNSVYTEFMETDLEDDDILSEMEDGDNSPRLSLNSVSRPCCFMCRYKILDADNCLVWPAQFDHTLLL